MVGWRTSVRRVWAAAGLTLILVACGGGSLTVPDYAGQSEDLVAVLAAQLESLDAAWESQTPTLGGARVYWDDRLAARREFLDGIQALDPPEELADLHNTAVELFSSIATTEEALAARVAAFETVADLEQMWETQEGQAAQAALEDVFELCRAAQTKFDATEERESLEDVAWIPAEMKQVIQVSFGCPE